MHAPSCASGVAAAVLLAFVCGGALSAMAQEGAGTVLPDGVQAVWDLDKAYRAATPTRERVCINGLWQWQPAENTADVVPTDGWGYLRVPESWPGGRRGGSDSEAFFPNPAWGQLNTRSLTAAWQQREITVPREWSGRRIRLHAEYINSYAAVYLDGRQTGEMRYPWGDVDLTSACRPGSKHTLSMLVVAMPLRAVMLSYSDTDGAREVRGSVGRKGILGDIYLIGEPQGPRIGDVKIDTSVRKWQITFQTALDGLDPQAQYALQAKVTDAGKPVAEFVGEPFQGGELSDGHTAMTKHWKPEKLWDTVTPQNQYDVSVSLLDSRGRVLDEAQPVRFGFREFWIDGRDFYLNGTRIYLSIIPINNGNGDSTAASYYATKATIDRYKTFGINAVYTHNYSCEPGRHNNFEEELKAADDEGMLVSFSQPHFSAYDWTTPGADETNGYAQHAAFYVHVAENHPSVVFYSTSHNGTGYAESMNPDMMDGIMSVRDTWSVRNASRARRAEAIIHKLDPSRIVYHHSSGNLGSMNTNNFYANFLPIQEMSDWFEHWATYGVKPILTCEFSVPILWDWAMYRGWYKGRREYGSARVPWEFCVAEWDAQFLGARSYDINEEEKENIRWEADQFRAGNVWGRNDYPYNLNSIVFPDRFKVVAMYVTDNWRAFRTWGMSANSPLWDHQSYWTRPRYEPPAPLAIDWDNLQRPGLRPAFVDKEAAKAQLAYDPADRTPTEAALALIRNNMPLLAYIGGKPDAFTSKDHNILPGETAEKQLIVINNSRETVKAECRWYLGLPQPISGTRTLTLPTGEQERIALALKLPQDLAPGPYKLFATVLFSNGDVQKDAFTLDVMPPPGPVSATGRIAVFDPKGETAKMLAGLGVAFDEVDNNASLSGYDALIVGKGALTLDGPAPDISRVRDGLKVVVFEQTGEVLEKRFGFRTAEYGLRWVFKRVPDHPLLAGLGDEHFYNWRGSSTILPGTLTYQRTSEFNYVPTVKWCGITVPRIWRRGNRGNVASALIEKPACGDFLPVLDGGYALQYTSLMEYREGAGMVLFCQTDVTGRTETDPAAEALARNIVRYATSWQPAAGRVVVYAGDPAGEAYLESTGLSVGPYEGGPLLADRLLVVGPGGGQALAASAGDVAAFLRSGGKVLAIGLDQDEADAFLPLNVATSKAEHIAAYFEPFGAGSPLAGVSPAEVHNRDPRDLPLVTSGATVIGDGVLAVSEDGNVVFCQLVPWQFDYRGEKMNVKRTFRRVSCLVDRLLANMGASGSTRLLDDFQKPVATGETRWLDGRYLDVPEEWDDPYRFFCW
jgi:beta-galactosidase